jgi:cellulose biosynthesis protein BcsQ
LKTVSFFNHKGGVGKTTIVFNTALALRELGHAVVVVDADAQTNLSGLAMSESAYEAALDDKRTIWSAVAPLVTGAGDIGSVAPVKIRDGVWILPGDIRLSTFESILPVGWIEALAGEARGYRVTSALFRVFQSVAEATLAEFVLVDLGPNVGALNRSALLASDGFVVPLAPDLFSLMALPSVGNSLRDWLRQWRTCLENLPPTVDFPLPEGAPIPLGYVSQQFSVYGSRPAAAFRAWLEKIPAGYDEGILEPLGRSGGEHVDQLGLLPNFASLVPIAQRVNKGLFELSGTEARGAQYTRAQDTRAAFSGIADRIQRGLSSEVTTQE